MAWCALALAWPAPVARFRTLRRDQVHATARRLLLTTDEGEWAVPGALTAWHAWEDSGSRFPALADSPWVLPALRRGPGLDSRIGGRLSNQALQVTFTKHARRTAQHLRATAAPSRRERAEELAAAYRDLSYDSYRRLALAAGAPPVSPARRRPGRPGPRPVGAPRRLSAAALTGSSGGVTCRSASVFGGVPGSVGGAGRRRVTVAVCCGRRRRSMTSLGRRRRGRPAPS